jgi:protein phosphatase
MQDQEPITAAPPAPRVEAAAATLAGRRALNADASLLDEAAGFFAVADGMRDLPRSPEVALAALRAVRDTLQLPWSLLPYADRTPEEAGDRLVLGIASAHAQLYEPSVPGVARIGTTFAGLVVCGGGYFTVAHVGNSRIYLLRRTRRVIVQITDDHTVLSVSERWGLPRPAVPASDARILTQAIGATRTVKPVPLVETWDVGDVALLCTDGLSEHVEPEEMAERLFVGGDPVDVAWRLVHRAREDGGGDDTTAVVVRRVS